MSSTQSTVASLPNICAEADTAPISDRRAYRMSSLDVLRGLVIVVMALDHVRDYFMIASVQDPTADPATGPLLFATRWITHFCAPTFVFLAGTSAGLMARRKRPPELASFLLTRGLWLIVLEVSVVSTAWSFSPTGIGARIYIGLQVIWAIGASMVVLAGALRVYFSYPLLPWIGVMLVGFGAAGLFEPPAKLRDGRLLRIGIGLVIAFVLVRAPNVYGDPHPWLFDPSRTAGSVMSFLGTTKYPPSLLYLLMTLGPAAIACAFAERLRGPVKDVLVTFGRAPLAFYIAHLYLIHALTILLGMAQSQAQQCQSHPSRSIFIFLLSGRQDTVTCVTVIAPSGACSRCSPHKNPGTL